MKYWATSGQRNLLPIMREEIEKYIARWKKQLHRQNGLEPGTIAELEDHLRQEVQQALAEGLTAKQAFNRASEAIGEIGHIGREEARANLRGYNSSLGLIKSYVLVFVRRFNMSRFFTVINLMGLSLGLYGFLYIVTFLNDEFNHDKMYPNAEKLYRLSYTRTWEDGTEEDQAFSSGLWAEVLTEEFPGISNYMRFLTIAFGYISSEDQEKIFYEEQIYWSDENFFDFTGFELKYGDASRVLTDLNNIVLTERMATKYFGEENPVGKKLIYHRSDRQITLDVSGVMYDPPTNSQFHPDFVTRIETLDRFFGPDREGWILKRMRPIWAFTYLQVDNPRDLDLINDRLAEMWETEIPDRAKNMKPLLTPVEAIHFQPAMKWEIDSPIDVNYLYGMAVIAAFILIVAIINFVNLSTAMAAKRAKEIGLRKTLGSERRQLILQFFTESFIYVISSMVLAIGVYVLTFDSFNNLLDKNIDVFSLLTQVESIGFLAGIIIITGFLSGLYPALYLSGFEPLQVLKGKFHHSRGEEWFRKVLVTLQFTIALLLIIGSLTVKNQLELINNGKLAQIRDQIIGVRTTGMGSLEQIRTFKTETSRLAEVEASTIGMHLPRLPGFSRLNSKFIFPAMDRKEVYWNKFETDGDFCKTYQLEFIAGTDFRHYNDSTGIIINEAALKTLGLGAEEVLGLRLTEDEEYGNFANISGTIIGVVKDFPYESIKQQIDPLLIVAKLDYLYTYSARVSTTDYPGILAKMKAQWHEVFGPRPFAYWFLDEGFEKLYKQERKLSKIIPIFSGLAIAIALLGLFALTVFVIETKQKEIGIRKVLGCLKKDIFVLLSRQFLWSFLIAALVSIPLSYQVMNMWLQNFAYRVNVTVEVVFIALVTVVASSIITVGFKFFQAADRNPVDSLKYE